MQFVIPFARFLDEDLWIFCLKICLNNKRADSGTGSGTYYTRKIHTCADPKHWGLLDTSSFALARCFKYELIKFPAILHIEHKTLKKQSWRSWGAGTTGAENKFFTIVRIIIILSTKLWRLIKEKLSPINISKEPF